MRSELLSLLRSHEAELRARGVETITLFGSLARDEATNSSDVDLAFRPGGGFSAGGFDHFKERFIDALKIAVAVYRDADIDIDIKGVLLRPSRAPVAPRVHAVAGPARVQEG